MACPSQCGDIDLVGNPQSGCETSLRRDTPSRILFFACTTTLPDPITDVNIAPLFADGSIVASSPIANGEWGEPTYEDIQVDDCSVPQKVLTNRVWTFQDRTAVSETSGSPAVTDEFHDYDFWVDKLNNQAKLNFMVAYCSGDVKVARAADGSLLTASITSYLNYDTPATAGAPKIEYKQVEVTFNGDPLAMTNKPEFNYIDAGIIL